MTGRQCNECGNPAAILDNDTGYPWCLDCGISLIRAGDPVLDYTELAEGPMYTVELNKRSTVKLKFG